jgi:hypothetical protein
MPSRKGRFVGARMRRETLLAAHIEEQARVPVRAPKDAERS